MSRSGTQAARYAYYHGRIQAVQLDYTAASDSLQQALRKVQPAACLPDSYYAAALLPG